MAWGLFGRQAPEEERLEMQRVHVDQPAARDIFRAHVRHFLRRLYTPDRRLVVLCIGTDRSTGDCLGPLVGTMLARELRDEAEVLGTLAQPVHAVNLEEVTKTLCAGSPQPFVIAIDACLGRSESVGHISLKTGPLQPGTGVNKSLPTVGDLHIVGIVNVGGFMEYMVLQNTRLSLVMQMAEIVAEALLDGIRSLPRHEAPSMNTLPPLPVPAEASYV